MSFRALVCIILLLSVGSLSSKCQRYLTPNNIQLITDYAEWRNIRYLVILEENIKLGCNLKLLKENMDKFTNNNIYLSAHSSINATERFIQGLKFKASVITFYNSQSREEFVEQANKITFSGEKLSWLIILLSGEDFVLDYLRLANFGLDADVVIAVGTMWARQEAHHQVARDVNGTQFENIKPENEGPVMDGEVDKEIVTFTPFIDNNNSSSYGASEFCRKTDINMNKTYCMMQIYKIRKFYNNSLVVFPLGSWTLESGTTGMKPFLNPEKRGNFFQFPLIFGEKNSSDPLVNENVIEDDGDESKIEEFAIYFSLLLNSSKHVITYSKLGNKNSDGEWSDLFKAIIKEEIDIGLDSIIKTPERFSDMVFTHTIMESRRSIYIQPQESNKLRDIFLVPFDVRLIQCVGGTAAILALVMVTYKKTMEKCQVVKVKNKDSGLLDSIMWSIGIFSQQGSIWQPGSYTERVILIVSLAFTLIIYNAYSAFITSVLSVKLTNIRTIDDLLDSDYEIGYAKNSQDEIYLRSMNITQLNKIYLRGYLHNNISNISEGLLKATQGNYGFFASSHIARRELLIISSYKCKYDIAEIPIKDTVNYIAFPMSKRSPYRKLINLSIIKMYESGVYKYIYPFLYPELQKCNIPVTYQSARLPDLTTPFAILILGIIFGIIIIVIECLWIRKKSLYLSVRKSVLPQKPVFLHTHQFPKSHHTQWFPKGRSLLMN